MKKKANLKFHKEVSGMRIHSYEKRRNASVITLSPSFKEAVKMLRSELGIPAEGFRTAHEMAEWYKRHHAENTQEPYKPMPHYYWHFPKEFVEMLDSFSYSAQPSRTNYYPDVPLDRSAMDLIRRFDLPEDVLDNVKSFILGAQGPLGISSALQLILVPVDEDEEGTKYVALVAGIDESATKKDWLEVWNSIETILHLSAATKAPYKRPIDKVLLRDLYFWEQVKGGKTAREVTDDWTELHPEDKTLVEDTVRKGVDRIDKIMKTEL